MGMCKKCGKVVSSIDMKDGYCLNCYNPSEETKIAKMEIKTSPVVNNGLKQMLGIIGSIILIVGVFAPLVSMPIVGSINYFHNGKGDGIFILAFSAISLIFVFAKQYKWLWLTGLGSLGLLTYTFFQFQSRISDMKADMEINLAGNPFRGLADVAIQSVQIQWGFALLAVGGILLIISASMKNNVDA